MHCACLCVWETEGERVLAKLCHVKTCNSGGVWVWVSLISFCPPGRYNIRTEPRENKTYFLVLEINGVNAQDAGNYKVTAKNALGESNATIRLNFDSECLLAFYDLAFG